MHCLKEFYNYGIPTLIGSNTRTLEFQNFGIQEFQNSNMSF